MKFFNSEGNELSYSDALMVVTEPILEGKRTIWDDFIASMKQYYRWYYPQGDDFDQNKMYVFDESRFYEDNQEIILDIWFDYRSSENDSMLYHVTIHRTGYQNDVEIYRYDLAHRTSFDIEDSQESHTV